MNSLLGKGHWSRILLIIISCSFLSFGLDSFDSDCNLVTEIQTMRQGTIEIADSQLEVQGYQQNDTGFVTQSNDPWFVSNVLNTYVSNLILNFDHALPQNTMIQIFFSDSGEEFSPDRVITYMAEAGNKQAKLSISQYAGRIRVDIGSEANQSIPNFTIRINDSRLLFVIIRLILFIFSSSVGVMFLWCMFSKIREENFEKLPLRSYMIAIGALFVFLVILKVNDSNIGAWNQIIPNNVNASNPHILGNPRAVRSDEWAIDVPQIFARAQTDNMGITSFLEGVVFYCNPMNWGYAFLPLDMAFSWSRMLPYFIMFISGFYFFRIFAPKQILFPLAGSLLLLFSPESIWWNSMFRYMYVFAIIDLFYYFFKTESKSIKALISIGLVICLSSIITNLYPAWHIPLFYLGIFIVVGIFVQEKKINWKRSDFCYVAGVLLITGAVAASYLITSGPFIEAVSNTVYPGKRFSNGGDLPLSYLSNYLLAPLTPFKDVPFSNNSEISAFITLFPIPILVYLFKRKQLSEFKVLKFILAFHTLCAVYMLIGFPTIISQLTLWQYSMSARINTIFGLTGLLLLVLEVFYLHQVKEKIDCLETLRRDGLLFNLSVVIFFYYVFMRQPQVIDYLGPILFLFLALGTIVIGNFALLGKAKPVLITLVIVTLISGATINPINFGTKIMNDTPIARTIQNIDGEDSGNWLTLDDLWFSKYIMAQGATCLNSLNYPPQLELFSLVDSLDESIEIYNRYAHVIVSLTEEPTNFELIQTDVIKVNLSINDLDKWAVKYIVTKQEMLFDTDELTAELVYRDNLDGYIIYKMSYV